LPGSGEPGACAARRYDDESVPGFLDRTGEAPPRFILVRDGKQLQYWDTKKAPDEITLLEAVLTAS